MAFSKMYKFYNSTIPNVPLQRSAHNIMLAAARSISVTVKITTLIKIKFLEESVGKTFKKTYLISQHSIFNVKPNPQKAWIICPGSKISILNFVVKIIESYSSK